MNMTSHSTLLRLWKFYFRQNQRGVLELCHTVKTGVVVNPDTIAQLARADIMSTKSKRTPVNTRT